MKTITVITILALLTISGAVISDQILTSQDLAGQQTVAARFWHLPIWWARLAGVGLIVANPWGTSNMLSVDQFLRLISVPAVVAAFLIASQVSGAGLFHAPPAQLASQ
jgi:hypothetical protein